MSPALPRKKPIVHESYYQLLLFLYNLNSPPGDCRNRRPAAADCCAAPQLVRDYMDEPLYYITIITYSLLLIIIILSHIMNTPIAKIIRVSGDLFDVCCTKTKNRLYFMVRQSHA